MSDEVKADETSRVDEWKRGGSYRMEAYYYAFDATGCEPIDRVLSAVAIAGKCAHHTESWNEHGCVDEIQREAVNAAKEVADLRVRAEHCNGSCDIALARRQVGPDGIVPGNARECAELWEREAVRLERDLANYRAALEQRDRDWDALLVEVALTVGDDDDREAAEAGQVDEFDPWHALRRARERNACSTKVTR